MVDWRKISSNFKDIASSVYFLFFSFQKRDKRKLKPHPVEIAKRYLYKDPEDGLEIRFIDNEKGVLEYCSICFFFLIVYFFLFNAHNSH